MTASFDYEAAAELYTAQSRARRRGGMSYRRFDRAGDAIRFAVEELPTTMNSAYLEVDDGRFDMEAIRALYRDAGYTAPDRASVARDR